METYEEWKEFVNKPGSISTVMSLEWLLKGCPKCGCQEWQLTNDGWCYCDGCSKGYSTYYIWTNRSLVHFDINGHHCFMCRGYGERDGERCDECGGRRTQPLLPNTASTPTSGDRRDL